MIKLIDKNWPVSSFNFNLNCLFVCLIIFIKNSEYMSCTNTGSQVLFDGVTDDA